MSEVLKCATNFCRGRTMKHWKKKYCPRCNHKIFREKNPLRYAFGNLRRRAKQRGKEFLLTFEQYVQFAIETGYDKLKGKTKYSLSINRKDPQGPYSVDNIEAVSLSLNSRLQFANMPARLKEEMRLAERNLLPF